MESSGEVSRIQCPGFAKSRIKNALSTFAKASRGTITDKLLQSSCTRSVNVIFFVDRKNQHVRHRIPRSPEKFDGPGLGRDVTIFFDRGIGSDRNGSGT